MSEAQDRIDAAGRDHEAQARIVHDPAQAVTHALLALTQVIRQYAVEQMEPNDITLTLETEESLYHGDDGEIHNAGVTPVVGDPMDTPSLDVPGPVGEPMEHYCATTKFIEPGSKQACGCAL
jgi:hypothetical protein